MHSHAVSSRTITWNELAYENNLFNAFERLFDAGAETTENLATHQKRSVLDNTIVLQVSDMADGRSHGGENVPCWPAGGLGWETTGRSLTSAALAITRFWIRWPKPESM